MGTYKTIRCRYFNDDGLPIRPYCNQGNRCNFIHPEDCQWPRRKSYSSTHHGKNRSRSRPSPGLESRRHSSPLAPQSAVFKRSVHEDDYATLTPVMRTYDEKARDIRCDCSPDHYERRDRGVIPREYQASLQPFNSAVQLSNTQASSGPPPHGKVYPYRGDMVMEKVVDSFKNIAKITNEAVCDSAEYEKEDEKLHAYNELSSALARLSPSSVAAIAPTLTTVVNNHAKYRDKVHTDFKRLAHAWEDVFELFVDAASRSIDAKLEGALFRIRDEANHQIKRIGAHERGSSSKRKFDDDWDIQSSRHRAESSRVDQMHPYDRSPGYKRQRHSPPSGSGERDERVLPPNHGRDDRSVVPSSLLNAFEERQMQGAVGDQCLQTNLSYTSMAVPSASSARLASSNSRTGAYTFPSDLAYSPLESAPGR